MALRWAKQPNERGLSRIVQGPRGFELRDGGRTEMHVAPLGRNTAQWYWYGHGKNTCASPVATAEEAKQQAAAHYRSVRAAL